VTQYDAEKPLVDAVTRFSRTTSGLRAVVDVGVARLIIATEAPANGSVTRRELRHACTMIHRNVQAPNGAELTAPDRALAGLLWSKRTAAVAGSSAAALLGSRWVSDDAPAELLGTHHRGPRGIVAHSGQVADDEIRPIGRVGCTTAARTAYDLGHRLLFVEGLIRVDALLNAIRIPLDDVHAIAARYPVRAVSGGSAGYRMSPTAVPNPHSNPECGGSSIRVGSRGC
jgi:hypothetical protein